MRIRKIILVVMLLVFLSSTNTVHANSGPPIIGINITPDKCTEDMIDDEYISVFEGNFDILVKKNDFDVTEFGDMTEQFKTFYPFYSEIDYLKDLEEGWTSFSAYYQEEGSWGFGDYNCGMQFGDSSIVDQLSFIKVVYFDDEGNTLFISDEIEVPSVYFYQDRNAIIYFNTDSLEITPSLNPHTDPYLIFSIILVIGFILYSIIIELVVALVFRLKTKKAILNILLINFITQGMMYLYFLVIFDAYRSQYFLHLFIFEGLVLVIEFLYLYWRLKPMFTWKHIALYVFISNLVSYLLGVLRYY